MACADNEVEGQLLDVGKRLASPPTNVGELLSLLDQTERFLSRVQQSPRQSMLDALLPTKRLLAEKRFLGHSDEDVKVAVASCISEITRITAPDAPYDDDLMKEVFQNIVDAFAKLDDISSLSFSKRVSILETVAKVRSCLVMLDLECDALILNMFHIFLRTIRPNHSENIFSSMGAIMTVVLEESEDISPELISCLLDAVKTDNKDILPIARGLGERVIAECALKLKPYLVKSAKSNKAFLGEYSEVVAFICEGKDRVEQTGINSAVDVMSSERPAHVRELDQRIVGVKIKVWWPDDKMFYDGTVADYDHMTKKHKILYDDGDVEVLLLKEECWEFIEEQPPSKRTKKSSNHAAREANVETPITSGSRSIGAGSMELPKRRGRPPKGGSSISGLLSSNDSPNILSKWKERVSSKSKDGIPKTDTKLKDGEKLKEDASKAEERSSRSGGKLKDDPHKSSRRFMDDSTKTVNKAKDDAVGAGSESRKDTPKSKLNEETHGLKASGESKTNGVPVTRKLKTQESEASSAKEKSVSSKEAESEASAVKKRKIKGNS